MPTVLLLTGFSPDMPYGGGAIVQSLVERFRPGQIAWFSLSAPGPDMPQPMKRLLVGHCGFRPRGRQRFHLGWFWDWYYRNFWAKRAARRFKSALAKTGAQTLWTVLDYSVVPVAAELAGNNTAQHVHYSFHDHPNAMAKIHCTSDGAVANIACCFDRIKAAGDWSCDAVSEELLVSTGLMERRHAVVTMGCRPERSSAEIRGPAKSGCMRIAYAGTYFPPDRAFQLVEGLRLWAASTGRAWEIHKFGSRMPARMPEEIQWRGFLAPDALAKELSAMSYLVLAFSDDDPAKAIVAATSLPTKLISYIEAGRLILALAPENSATARIVRQNRIGLVIASSDARAVATAVENGLSWDMDAANAGRQKLLREEFHPDLIFERFVRVLGSGTAGHDS